MNDDKKNIIHRLQRTINTYGNLGARRLAVMIYDDYLEPVAPAEQLIKSGAKRNTNRGTKRNLTRSMVEALKLVVDAFKFDGIEIFYPAQLLKEKRHRADFAKLRHWGFISQVEFGQWKLNQKAVAFVYYNEPAFKYIYEKQGRATWKSREAIRYNEIIN